MTHACLDAETRAACGISPGLLRLSAGLEVEWELIGDLAQALDKAANPIVAHGAPPALRNHPPLRACEVSNARQCG
jgi:hypothetical protein